MRGRDIQFKRGVYNLNKKWTRITIGIFCFVFIIGICGLFTANYAVDKVIDSMAEQIERGITEETKDSGNLSEENNELVYGTDNLESNNDVEGSYQDIKDNTQPTTEANREHVNTKIENKIAQDEIVSTNSIDSSKYKPDVTANDMNSIKEEITLSDKSRVISILMKNLKFSDLKHLQEIAIGGITVSEKKEARNIIMSNMSSEQYNELSQIAKKYGVSEGRSYEEILGGGK